MSDVTAVAKGRRAVVGRATFSPRRKLLRMDYLVVLALVAIVVGTTLLVSGDGHPSPTPSRDRRPAGAVTDPPRARPPTPTSAPVAAPVAPVAAPPAAAPSSSAPSSAAPGSPDAMGAAALALVRYPWQQLPGYSILVPARSATLRHLGSTATPTSPGARPGGVSTMYVYPGETVDKLAGITAFEIGHEVDAAYVEPQGGHDQIAGLLGVHPASWAPECDCAEQGYLSGWYARRLLGLLVARCRRLEHARPEPDRRPAGSPWTLARPEIS